MFFLCREKSGNLTKAAEVLDFPVMKRLFDLAADVMEENLPERFSMQRRLAQRRPILVGDGSSGSEGEGRAFVTNVRIALMREGDAMEGHADKNNRPGTHGFDFMFEVPDSDDESGELGSLVGGELVMDDISAGLGKGVIGNFRKLHSVNKIVGPGTRLCVIGYVGESSTRFDDLVEEGAVRLSKGKKQKYRGMETNKRRRLGW